MFPRHNRTRTPRRQNSRPAPAVIGLIVAGLVVGSAASPAHADPPLTISVSPQQKFQEITGWGTSLAWWANVVGGWSPENRDAVMDALFDPDTGLGLNVVRYNIGGVTPTQACSMAGWHPGAAVQSFQTADGVWDWTKDATQRWVLDAAKARGVDTVQAFANSAPSWMTVNGCSGGNSGMGNLAPARYQDYVDYLVEVTDHFRLNWGTTFHTLEPFNEPSQTWPGTRQEGMGLTTAAQNDILEVLAPALAGSPTAIAANDGVTFDSAYNAYMSFDPTVQASIDTFTTHAYGGSNRAGIYNDIALGDGKDVWMSEWGAANKTSEIAAALAVSAEILLDQQNLHPSVWAVWQPIAGGPSNPATDNWGLLHGSLQPSSDQQITKPARYWAMANYSKFIRQGAIMIGDDNPNTMTAYHPDTDTLTIVRTNPTTTAVSNRFNLAGFASLGTAVDRYRTSATESLVELADLPVTNEYFDDVNPAQSITTYVIHDVLEESTNLLGNGGFETGSLAPWLPGPTSPPASVGTGNPLNGSFAAQIVPTTSQNASIYQTIVAPVTGTYSFSAHTANATSNVQIGIQVNGWQKASLNAAAGPYRTVAASFTAQAGQTIKIYVLSVGSASTTYVDDVVLLQ